MATIQIWTFTQIFGIYQNIFQISNVTFDKSVFDLKRKLNETDYFFQENTHKTFSKDHYL